MELAGIGLLTGVGFVLLFARFSTARAGGQGTDPDWDAVRAEMVDSLRAYGIHDERVLAAMAKIPRHEFIPEEHRVFSSAYGDHPCPIGYGQTISQPYIVAYMTEKIAPRAGDRILEIGTGSGYQAAILAELGADVYTVEIVPALADHAVKTLAAEGYPGVHVLVGDGYKGWPEHAPYNAVIVTCAPDRIPDALVQQLAEGGRMIVPVGAGSQRLVILKKQSGRVDTQEDLPVAFVPMVHEDEK